MLDFSFGSIKKLFTYGLLLSANPLFSGVSGVRASFPSEINVTNLNSTTGRMIFGAPGGYGANIVALPDINGDGWADIGLGVFSADIQYVIFGSDNLPFPINVSALNGTNGFVIPAIQSGDQTGEHIVAADINSDLKPELFLVSSNGGPNNEGTIHVIPGRDNWPAVFDRTTNPCLTIYGPAPGSYFGADILITPDGNNDGKLDILASAPLANTTGGINSGEIYQIFSNPNWLITNGSFFVSRNLTNSTGFKISGVAPQDYIGSSLQNLENFNNATHAVAISSIGYNWGNRSNAGAAHIVYDYRLFNGRSLSVIDGMNGITFVGAEQDDQFGEDFEILDVNLDGNPDLVMSALFAGENNNGRVYIVFGPITYTNPIFDLSSFNSTHGVIIYGESAGRLSQIAACDMTGDGKSDLVLGSPNAHTNSGKVYIFPANATWPPVIYLNDTNPFWTIVHGEAGPQNLGYSLSCTENFACGGGKKELLITAPRNGKAYVICGEALPVSPTSASSTSQTAFSSTSTTTASTSSNSVSTSSSMPANTSAISSATQTSSVSMPSNSSGSTNLASSSNQNTITPTSMIPSIEVFIFSYPTDIIPYSLSEGIQLTTDILSISNLGNTDPSLIEFTRPGTTSNVHIFVNGEEADLFTYAALLAGDVNLFIDATCLDEYEVNLRANVAGNSAAVDVNIIFEATQTTCGDGSTQQINKGLLVSSLLIGSGLFKDSNKKKKPCPEILPVEDVPDLGLKYFKRLILGSIYHH